MIPSIYELATFCQNDPTDCLIYQEKEENLKLEDRTTEVPSAING
jgi:hypothetical protein